MNESIRDKFAAAIFSAAGSWFVSREVAKKIRVGLEEFAILRRQFEPLLSIPSDASV